MSVDSYFRQLQVQFEADGVSILVDPLRSWWNLNLVGGDSLASACSANRSEAILVEGIRQCLALRCDEFVGALVVRYFRYASEVPVQPDKEPEFFPPLWLCWIRDTARALEQWKRSRESLTPELDIEFVSATWAIGLKQIAAGFPRAASRLWKEAAQRLIEDKRKADTRLHEALSSLRECVCLAQELRLPPPSCPEDSNTPEAILKVLAHWRETTLDPEIVRLFWAGHQPFLESTRQRIKPPLAKDRKRKLTQLINSSLRGHAPESAEIRALCAAYSDVFDEVLDLFR